MHRPGLPAWKRLGLKLKYANENSEKPGSGGILTYHRTDHVAPKATQTLSPEPPRKKRKTEDKARKSSDAPLNNRDPSQESTGGTQVKSGKALEKRVAFSADTKAAPITANGKSEQDTPKTEEVQPAASGKKPKKKATKKSKQPPIQKSDTALEYLNQYHTARANWKFNKNRETWVLKHVFSENDIPREYDLALAKYIRGLQGAGARDRLKVQCVALLQKKNDAQKGVIGPEDGADQGLDEERPQWFKSELAKPPVLDLADERDDDKDQGYQSWIGRQPRPKILLWALGVDDEAVVSNNLGTKSKTGTEHVNGLGNATKSKVKKRKNRTAVVDYDSSSSSSSPSESETENEDSDDEPMSNGKLPNGHKPQEETSSSGSDEEDSSSDGDSTSDGQIEEP